MSSKIASALDNLTEHLNDAFVSYSDAALRANEGEPANVVDAIANAGRNVRIGLERLADAIEATRGAPHIASPALSG